MLLFLAWVIEEENYSI